jgi:hypothetical protein
MNSKSAWHNREPLYENKKERKKRKEERRKLTNTLGEMGPDLAGPFPVGKKSCDIGQNKPE